MHCFIWNYQLYQITKKSRNHVDNTLRKCAIAAVKLAYNIYIIAKAKHLANHCCIF